MTKSSLLRLLLPGWMLCIGSLCAQVHIVDVTPTVLFSNEATPRQIAWIDLDNDSDQPVHLEAAIKAGGSSAGPLQALTAAPGRSKAELFLPDIAKPMSIEIELLHDGKAIATRSEDWKPQRKWKVFVVKSSHQDIGYENFLFVKASQIADHIDMAREISGPPDPAPDSPDQIRPSYHYYLESLLFPRYYIQQRSETEWRHLVEEKIRPGSMGLGGAPSGVHTHWMDYEELIRTTYPARREFRDRFQLDLDTYTIVDNPSMSWSTAQVLAESGFKYAVRFGQRWRTGGNNDYATTGVPAIFWWRGPDQDSRVLYAWCNRYSHSFWFGETVSSFSELLDLAAINVNRELLAVQEQEELGPYPWDALLVPTYRDNTTPAWDNTAFEDWREKYRYPEIRIADPRDYMRYMEEKFGDDLPELSGDLNNFSADYSTIDPESQGWKRRAARLLPFAEGVHALARKLDPAFPSQGARVARTYERMHDFDEHSWPTGPRPLDFHQFNPQWGKRREGEQALLKSKELLSTNFDALTSHVQTGPEPLLLVFNPLAHVRTDIVVAPGRFHEVIDESTGKRIPAQPQGDGTSVFIADDVPAFGYRGFRINESARPAAPAKDLAASGTRISNAHYELRFSPETGAVISLRDRGMKREVLDTEAPYHFNQLVFVDKEGKESLEGETYAPQVGASLSSVTGPVFTEMRAEFQDPRLGDAVISQVVRLYTGLRRFDVTNDLRHFGALHSDFQGRYRKNVFYAFPVAVDDFVARAEYAGGVVRPYDDQLRWGTHDYLHANRWVDVSNQDYGVTMMPWNAATVHFGEIRYNEFSINYKPSRSHLYSFAWSNRMAGLRELAPADWNTTLHYSFSTHPGGWTNATEPAWNVASPLEARIVEARAGGSLPPTKQSMLSIDAPNVQLVVLKESEQPGRGFVVRIVETQGKDTDVTLDATWLGSDSASLCDLVENDRESLPVRDGRVRLRLGAYAFATVRLYSAERPPAAPANLALHAQSDSAVGLSWSPVKGAAAYNIYRSSDPEAPATLQSLVGRSNSSSFTDEGLDIAETYHYQVAAVTANNTQGQLTRRSAIRTELRNTSAPSPVEELGVVRLTENRLMVCWSQSPDSDVARYLVYRGDHPDFVPGNTNFVTEVAPGEHPLEYHIDARIKPGASYYYRVLPEDWAGNRQLSSPVAAGETSLEIKQH